MKFFFDFFNVKDLTTKTIILMKGIKDGLYIVPYTRSSYVALNITTKVSIAIYNQAELYGTLLHDRLRHAHFDVVKVVAHNMHKTI